MPTSDQRDAVRYDFGATAVEMPDAEIDALYARAAIAYPGLDDVQEAWLRWTAAGNLKIQAAKRSDYKQNQSSETLSQVFAQLNQVEQDFYNAYLYALKVSTPEVMFGGLRRSRPRLVEYPMDAELPNVAGNNGTDDVSRLVDDD